MRMESEQDRRNMLIGIDGGGTKTEFIGFRPDGTVVSREVLGGSNPNSCGLNGALDVLREGIDRLCAAGVTVGGIFAGVAGCATGRNGEELSHLLRQAYPAAAIEVGSDILNVMDSVRGSDRCAAAICGTGSSVFGRNENGLRRVGGWGYLLDGAGSGFDIGRDALRRCLESETGMCPAPGFAHGVRERLGGNVLEQLDVIYARGADFIASFAPEVFGAYAKGDAAAEEILQRNIAHVAKLVNLLTDEAEYGDMLILAGGLTAHRSVFESLLPPLLKREMRLVFPVLPPVYGACLRCMKLFGLREYDAAAFDAAFADGYRELKGERLL